jgi:formate dehydrogenase major subunit
MPKLKELLLNWPVIKQIKNGGDGTGEESWTERTRTLKPKTHDCEVSRSVCPYCAVGCGQLIYHQNNKMVAIMGDPGSPISRGRLCPKGSATYQLHTHSARLSKVKYRRPYSTKWEDLDLETAMDMIADRVWETRQRTFEEKNQKGEAVLHTLAMAHLGGATMDIEENYLIKKLFCAGLGMNCISNQARI